MALTLITAPVGYPVTLDEAKSQVLQGTSVDDAYIQQILIPAATERAELATRRVLLTQTWDLLLDEFPPDVFIELPKPPLQSVSYLKYYDTSNALQTWATSNYVTEAPAGPRCARGRLARAYSIVWPSLYGEIGDVTIRFVCGYGTADDVPAMLKAAILMDVATMYAQRENVITGTIVTPVPHTSADIYKSYRSLPVQQPPTQQSVSTRRLTWRVAAV